MWNLMKNYVNNKTLLATKLMTKDALQVCVLKMKEFRAAET